MQLQKRNSLLNWILILVGAVAVLIVAALGWYLMASRPVDPSSDATVRVEIQPGMTPDSIARELKDNEAIRSSLAFIIHAKVQRLSGSLQAGGYDIPQNYSLKEVVALLSGGSSDSMTITFYPGATLFDPRDIEDTTRTDVYTMLVRAGFDSSEVRSVLSGQGIESPLFEGKPAGANLEGYLYGETYLFGKGTSLPDIIGHVLDSFYQEIEKYDIEEKAQARGFTLFEAITLASIIEKEVACPDSTEVCHERRQVAQVFLSRLDTNMPLGSDPTFVYAADQQNQPRSVNFDSPYNTRIHGGLPPGPIATPSISSLRALVDPTDTDYLYFVAGDDGKTYFSRTFEEHNQNISRHCIELCRMI